jgi:hypothetical protein
MEYRMEYLTIILSSLAFTVPFLILWGVAIAFAATRYPAHPRVSMLVIIAGSIGIIEALTGSLLSAMPVFLVHRDLSSTQMATAMMLVRAVMTLASLAAMTLVVVAVFSGREKVMPTLNAQNVEDTRSDSSSS